MLRFSATWRRLMWVTALLVAAPSVLLGWGYWAHPRINRTAILALPTELRGFFYDHADFLTESAIVPDLRKHVIGDREEGPRHFCDLEDYGKPVAELPRTPEAAKATFEKGVMSQRGSLPWHLQEVYGKLVQAMKDRRKSEILLLAADLGHYLGDAHMPFHTTKNHDGQLTEQKGIHSLWEAQIPEQFGGGYNLRIPTAQLLTDPTAEVWRIIDESHQKIDSVLRADKKLRAEIGQANLFEVNEQGAPKRNRFGQAVFTKAYAARLQELLHGMQERQMRAAATATASFWYTAWVNAGKPDLQALDPEWQRQATQAPLQAELELFAKGKLTELPEMAEYQ